MKSEKGNSDRQPDAFKPERGQMHHRAAPVQIIHRKIGVFKKGEQPQVQCDGQGRRPLAPAVIRLPVNPLTQKKIEEGREQHEEDESRLAPGIEKDAKPSNQRLRSRRPGIMQPSNTAGKKTNKKNVELKTI